MITDHPFNNVTENIFAKIGANLHRRPDHPICIIKEAIYSFFDERHPGVFTKLDDLYPVVTAAAVGSLSFAAIVWTHSSVFSTDSNVLFVFGHSSDTCVDLHPLNYRPARFGLMCKVQPYC